MEVTKSSSVEIINNLSKNNQYLYYLLCLRSTLCFYINMLIPGSYPKLIATLYLSTVRLPITLIIVI